MKRKIAISMAICFAFSTVVPTFASVTFDDINIVPWQGAEVFINRAGELEIMVGEVIDGKRYFRAKDNITCFETVQIIYSVLSKTGNLKDNKNIESKWSYVMEQLSVPKWAYPSISYALEYGIVSMTEVGKFTNSSNFTPNFASREAVAVMLGKAMADKYSLDPNASLTFADSSYVNDTSVQYVELLHRLGIIMGDNNNFKPKSPINRAEMATMITKAYDKLNTGNNNSSSNNSNITSSVPEQSQQQEQFIASGTVAAISNMGSSYLVTILKDDGTQIGLFANTSTIINNIAGGSSNYTTLSPSDVLKDIVYIGSDIKRLSITYDASSNTSQNLSGTIDGTINDIYNDMIYINKSSGGVTKYPLNINCEYILDSRRATQKDIFDAFGKGRVDISATLNVKGEVTKLDCKSKESEQMYGEVKSISKNKIRIKKDGKNITTDYNWVNNDIDDVDFYLEDKSSSYSKVEQAFKDYDAMYVKYVTDSKGDIKKIYASKRSFNNNNDDDNEEEIKGTIKSITKSYVSVKKSGSSSYKEYDFEDRDVKNATLKINNKTYDYYDFKDKLDEAGTMSVVIELNRRGEVDRVLAKTDDDSNNSNNDRSGIIKLLTSSEIAVGSTSNKYELANNVSVSSNINGINNLNSLREHFDDGSISIEADLTIRSDLVTEINAHIKEVQGELRYFDKRRGELEVRTNNGITMIFDFKASSIDVRGDVRDIDDLDYYINERNRDYDITVDVNKTNGYADRITVKER